MRKVFLTGSAGFIGSHLIPNLLERGSQVTGYDNLSTGRYSDIEPFIGHANFKFVEGDLLDANKLKASMAGHDLIWHLGANTLIPPGGTNLRLDFDNNVTGTVNVLEAMLALEIRELLFASTAAVYGDEPGISLSEGFGPLHPISLYGASKLACEAFISAYSHLFGIYATIFRFSNVVGGGMGHGIAFDLIQKLKKNPKELRIWGDGKGEKPYFLVEDCIHGMLSVYNLPPDVRPLCDTYNLGNHTTTSVDKVAQIVCEEMGLENVKFIHEGGRHGFPGDVPKVFYNTDKIASFGLKAFHTSDESVRIAVRRLLNYE